MRVIKTIIFLIIALIIGTFGAHNSDMVPVDFYPFDLKLEIAIFFLFFTAMVLGIILTSIIGAAKILSMRKLIKLKNKEIKRLEKEVDELRPKQVTTYGH